MIQSTFLLEEPHAKASASLAFEKALLTLEATSCSHLAQSLNDIAPRWLVWENVPGVLSSNGGKDFGAFLGMLAELGYGVAYRVLDAQFFGVAQRRRRVFVVGYLGDWRPAAAVLFERQSLSVDSAPSRKTGQGIATGFKVGPGTNDFIDVAPTLDCRAKNGPIQNQVGLGIAHALNARTTANCLRAKSNDPHRADTGNYIAHSLRAQYDASEDGTGRGTPPVPCQAIPISTMAAVSRHGDDRIGLGIGKPGDPSATLSKAHSHAVANGMAVRRLTPRECERLMGFPDDYTRIPERVLKSKPNTKHFSRHSDYYSKNEDGTWTRYAADGPRYKALGNSMAVPVMRWIGDRIQKTEWLIFNGS